MVYIFCLVVGFFLGIYTGNRKIRHAIMGMIRSNDYEDYDEDDDE